ncbi:MAG: transporter [Alphaproteobacteria bacterium]|nr:transporter [Alphaproteobacteria bacterium]
MGTFTPALTGLAAVAPAVGDALPGLTGLFNIAQTVTGTNAAQKAARQQREQQALALKQLQEKQAVQLRDLQEQAALDRATIDARAAQAETDRRAALKRAVARQRAAFGASGIGNQSSGSNEAVLLGLFSESEADRAAREKLDTLRFSAIDQNIEAQKRINVLQASQLAEKQRVQRVSGGVF